MLLKKIGFLLISLFSAGSFAYTFNETSPVEEGEEVVATGLKIGDAWVLADRKMPSTSGDLVSLKSLSKDKGLLVIFSCNTCPFVVGNGDSEGWEGRYNGLAEKAADLNIGSVLVNSNEAKRPGDDSLEEMIKHAKDANYSMTYALDKESELANAFGAKTTPHVYLFNNEGSLVYMGAIDDNNGSAADVEKHYLIDAMNELAKGEAISTPSTRPLGCSIKRVK